MSSVTLTGENPIRMVRLQCLSSRPSHSSERRSWLASSQETHHLNVNARMETPDSIIAAAPSHPIQPFQCRLCHSRFTRHENLKRHAEVHSRLQDHSWLSCEFCTATFSRADLRHRHVRRKHPEHGGSPHVRTKSQADRRRSSASPAESNNGWLGCDQIAPSSINKRRASPIHPDRIGGAGRDYAHDDTTFPTNAILSPSIVRPSSTSGINGIDQSSSHATPNISELLLGDSPISPRQPHSMIQQGTISDHPSYFNTGTASFSPHTTILDQPSPMSPSKRQNDWVPSTTQITRGCDLYFAHVAHYAPLIHQATFSPSRAAPYLLLSMLCLAYQYGEDPDSSDQTGTGANLSERAFHRASALISHLEEDAQDSISHVSVVQSYLLLQICAMMFLCGKDSSHGLKIHSKMIFHARAGGLMQPTSPDSLDAADLESLWKSFIQAESLKRTLFAIHQIDALWYQILSIPRQLSHLEIKNDLPFPDLLWEASSAAEWAHRQLISQFSLTQNMKYQDAVRCFLSLNEGLLSIPIFDPYGAISITQFLISSAREISGWCTMTGRMSLDRIEPLKESLTALGLYFCRQEGKPISTPSPLFEITWQSAMIEYQIWSLSHIGGRVEGSIDSLLRQSTHRSLYEELLCDSSIVQAIQPHVNWFLDYLDTTTTPIFEAPWVILYAYRTFLIAWQLICNGTVGAMDVVGIRDGDTRGALAWAKKVFQRRERWRLGRLVMECLLTLEKDSGTTP